MHPRKWKGTLSVSFRQNKLPFYIYSRCWFSIYTLGPCTGLKLRPRPGPQIWFEALARPGPATVVRTRPANWIMRPGPAHKKYVQDRPGPQHNGHIWGPGPARARGFLAGPLARPHSYTTKTAILLLCTHSNITWLLSCFVHTITCILNVCVKSSMDKKYV